jgi:dolichyl-phosphate beta-glucosyltransferase
MTGKGKMDLSIIIPVLNESKKIARDIEEAAAFLQDNHFTGEIIVVDDGSDDNTVEAARETKVSSGVTLKVIRYGQNRGKGYAVCTGIRQSCGEYVIFVDSGCCVPYENALRGLGLLKTCPPSVWRGGARNISNDGCDIAHGSRKIQGSNIVKAQSLYRRICARIFHWFVILYMKIPAEITDTQCGFKIYKGDVARRLYGECVTDGFGFDIEIIMRAQKKGYKIKEFPVDWTCDRDSRLSPTHSFWRILLDLITISRILAKK